MLHPPTVETRIIEAAKQVFLHNGYEGAKMRDIASKANINISMLHYYYRSKDKLFDIVFGMVFDQLYGKIFAVVAGSNSLESKIEQVVNIYTDILTKDPKLPTFIFNEVTQHPERMIQYTRYKTFILEALSQLQAQIDSEVAQGRAKEVNMIEFFLDIESMCMYPFLTKALWQRIFDMDDQGFNTMIEKRKQQYIDRILKTIKK